ncbi:hypothetical protein LTS18_011203, partial [Coniosporium uncinatum]
MSTIAQQQKIRRIVMTGAIAAITATGAWYGATLKTDRDYIKARKTILEASPEEKISQLETARGPLLMKRTELEKKISEIQAR